VVVAPNIDEGNFTGGLDDTVNEVIALGRAAEDVDVLFALSKKKLGKALGKHVKVSAVGVSAPWSARCSLKHPMCTKTFQIYSMDGAYDIYKKVVRRLAELK
jgi:hypothetical protein